MVSSIFPVTLSDVSVKRRGKLILGPVELTVGDGGPLIVLGPNGSGKTTLLRVIHGIERVSEGTVQWAEERPERHAFVFQSPIIMRRTVAENLAYPLRLIKAPKSEITNAVSDWLKRIGLEDRGSSQASRLSGGERQKLALARALIRRPEVLFLDEPCANLDGHATREIESLLQEASASGTRVIMATHNIGQARRMAQSIVFMLGGKVHETGEAAQCLFEPLTDELAAFLKGDIVV